MSKIEKYIPLLESKKQIILYGPPGTGKTYSARMLATEFVKQNKGTEPINDELIIDQPQIVISEVIKPEILATGDKINPKIIFTDKIPSSIVEDSFMPKAGHFTYEEHKEYYERALLIMMGHTSDEIKTKTGLKSESTMAHRVGTWIGSKTHQFMFKWNENTGEVWITEKGAKMLQENGLIYSWDGSSKNASITKKGENVLNATKLSLGWSKTPMLRGV